MVIIIVGGILVLHTHTHTHTYIYIYIARLASNEIKNQKNREVGRAKDLSALIYRVLISP
jgi:hypothetical protein